MKVSEAIMVLNHLQQQTGHDLDLCICMDDVEMPVRTAKLGVPLMFSPQFMAPANVDVGQADRIILNA